MNNSELSIAAIRSLGIDIINKANSGHPGMTLSSAPALYTLYTKHINVNPNDSKWFNRDRFVLASGHASALLYSILHLSGFYLTMDDLKEFRQWHSKTPGHPEYGVTDGVDASSGPLGQGIPTALGMALAEKYLSEKFNKPELPIINHYTYALCGDGDMEEGVTQEAASLAGHLSLGKLIVLYDANNVTLDGPLSYSFSEDVKKRFEALCWQVIEIDDGNDSEAINKAIRKAKKDVTRPSLIIMHTIIGFGSSKQGTNATHGAPLGKEDGIHAKKVYGYDYPEFTVPAEVYDDFKTSVIKRGKREYKKWQKLVSLYKEQYPDEYAVLSKAVQGVYDFDYDEFIKGLPVGLKEATRDTSLKIINEIAKQNPTYLSGTADLASSTKTLIKDGGRFSPENYTGRNIYFGIREFAMTCIMNGVTLHGGVKISAGGFLVFSDYLKAGLSMAALLRLPIILPLSHDSIAVGEDGPTHQPIEQLAMLRSIPNVQVMRPADANEICACWKLALETKDRPTCLILSRQPLLNYTAAQYGHVKHGGYIVSNEKEKCEGIIIATGSEVSIAIKAQEDLLKLGHDIRVVSIPCMEIFDEQSDEYKETVLPKSVRKRLGVEMSTDFGWGKYIGLDGKMISVNTFGTSAPADVIIPAFGFDADNIVKAYLNM